MNGTRIRHCRKFHWETHVTDVEGVDLWAAVPEEVRGAAQSQLRRGVVAASGIAHGSASTALLLELEDGHEVFFKGIDMSSVNQFMRRALKREEHIYRELGKRLRPWAPAMLGSASLKNWHFLLLEKVGSWDAPPWQASTLRDAARGYACFHAKNRNAHLPNWLNTNEWRRFAHSWRLSTPMGREDADHNWLRHNGGRLRACAARLARSAGPHTLLHLDTRSDNMVIHHRQLRLFDWAMAGVGPAEFDVAAFAQSIHAEGGPKPRIFLDEYRHHAPLDSDLLLASVAAIAGYFWHHATQPPVPEVPGLRPMQRKQLRACLEWLATERVCDTPLGLSRIVSPVTPP